MLLLGYFGESARHTIETTFLRSPYEKIFLSHFFSTTYMTLESLINAIVQACILYSKHPRSCHQKSHQKPPSPPYKSPPKTPNI